MSVYLRTTRECTVSQLAPSLSEAIRSYFQVHQIGDIESEPRMCCETIAEKRNTGSLANLMEGSRDTSNHLVTILTPDWLVWASSGDQTGMVVSGAMLKVVKVKAFVSRRSKDMGLDVAGFINGSKEYVRGNLEMGPELAAQKFCEEVGQAVNKQLPPPKKRFFGLISG
jgi:hypothetical protein